MPSHRVAVPATTGLSWVLSVPELLGAETRPATTDALAAMERSFDADADERRHACRACRIARLLARALDEGTAGEAVDWRPDHEVTD